MRCVAQLSIVMAILGCLPVAHVNAHGAAGGAGGGGVGAFALHQGPAALGLRGGFARGPGFAHSRRAIALAHRPLRQARFARAFQMTLPVWWGGIWLGYPGDWWSGNDYQPAQLSETPPPQPQVIVINADANPRLAGTDTITMPDYGYVQGCHAIANGYHCDLPDATR